MRGVYHNKGNDQRHEESQRNGRRESNQVGGYYRCRGRRYSEPTRPLAKLTRDHRTDKASRLASPHIGAVTASAFEAEKYFDVIRVFERRETAGGTW